MLVLLASLSACPFDCSVPETKRSVGCPEGTTPCGNGCRPAKDTVCCDDGTRHTSSYCTNAAGGGCYANDRSCAAGFPLGATAQFCCAANGSFGSNDCPADQHHCGLSCQPLDEPCCEGDDCTSFGSITGCAMSANPCAYCPDLGTCHSCPANFCCADDICAEEGTCVPSTVCTGVGGGGSGDCTNSSDCAGDAICVSTRNCIKSIFDESCDCAGSTDGTCADFLANGINVSECGDCNADYSACCPGSMCVNGTCQASCP